VAGLVAVPGVRSGTGNGTLKPAGRTPSPFSKHECGYTFGRPALGIVLVVVLVLVLDLAGFDYDHEDDDEDDALRVWRRVTSARHRKMVLTLTVSRSYTLVRHSPCQRGRTRDARPLMLALPGPGVNADG